MFRDKVCVITGGALGIGRCLAQEFSKVGLKIAFIDVNKIAGEKNKRIIEEAGGECYFFHGDLSSEETLENFVEAVIEKYGTIDYLVNNAAFSKGGIHTPTTYEDFNYVLKTGVLAPYMLTQLFLPYFNEGAAIVNISSSRAEMSQANTESYSAAKGGIKSLTHALSISLAGKIRVNAISPGWIETGEYYDEPFVPNYSKGDIEQHPSKRIGHPTDIARAALFLCDERNSFINGENITIDGGMSKLMIYSGDDGWEYSPENV